MNQTIVGTRIRERRNALRISQLDLATKAGYRSVTSVSKIEKGKQDIPSAKVELFAEILQTTPDYLHGITSNPNAVVAEEERETMSPLTHEVYTLMSLLTDADQNEVAHLARYLYNRDRA